MRNNIDISAISPSAPQRDTPAARVGQGSRLTWCSSERSGVGGGAEGTFDSSTADARVL
jgi:hypothetical protein